MSAWPPNSCISDPLHAPGPEGKIRWSRANIGEFITGVPAPLTWDLWQTGTQKAGPEIYYRMGLAKRSERISSAPGDAFTNILYGWPVCNVDAMRKFIDRAGVKVGDSFEENMLGNLNAAEPESKSVKSRRVISAIKTSAMLLRYPAELARMREETRQWWTNSVRSAETASLDAARQTVAEGFRRYPSICVTTGIGGTIGGQIVFAALESAIPAGCEHLLTKLIVTGDDLAEVRMVNALWATARGQDNIQSFTGRYGYYGSDAGECLNLSWRENPEDLENILKAYRLDAGELDPALRTEVRRRSFEEAISELARHAGFLRMRYIKRVLKYCQKVTRWREEGKACTLMVHDVVRAGARAVGRNLVRAGHMKHPDDVFFLTQEELMTAPFDTLKETVRYRRARRNFYETLDVPGVFIGSAPLQFRGTDPVAGVSGEVGGRGHLSGTGVSPGTAVGTARVVSDPADCETFAMGDILICRNTDPGWSPLFTLAGGIVTDIGGMLSHGAIIARELNVPCIVNTKTGTQDIPDGAIIQLDGTSGDVIIIPSNVSEADGVK